VLFPLTPWFSYVFVRWTFWQWDVNFTSKFRYYDNWPNCFLHRNVLVTLRGGISCEWWIQKIWKDWHVACFKVVICKNWGIPLMMSVKEAVLMSGFESRTYEYEAGSQCSLISWSVIAEYVHETVLVYRLDIFAHKYTSDRHNLTTKIMWTETMRIPKEMRVYPGQYSGPRASVTLAFCPSADIAYIYWRWEYFIILILNLALNSMITVYFTSLHRNCISLMGVFYKFTLFAKTFDLGTIEESDSYVLWWRRGKGMWIYNEGSVSSVITPKVIKQRWNFNELSCVRGFSTVWWSWASKKVILIC